MQNSNYRYSDQKLGRDNNNVQRNENVRWVYENEVENQGRNYYMEPNSITGGDGITFNRHTIEENEHAQQQVSSLHGDQHTYKVRAIYLEKFPVDCKESTGYGRVNDIPAKVTRDS